MSTKVKTLSEIEHILHRPTMYIGSNVPAEVDNFIIDDKTGQFEKKSIESTDGLIKIIDEVISNSVDYHIECKDERSKLPKSKQNKFHVPDRVDITITEDGEVTVSDNGGIKSAWHKQNGCYVPYSLFGVLRTGSNYDDTGQRFKIGTNGFGVKLTNIFSKELSISTCDGETRYEQSWSNNMREVTEPTITQVPRKRYTQDFPKKANINIGLKTEKSIKVNFIKGDIGERGTTIKFKIDMSAFPNEDTISYGIMKLLECKAIYAAAANRGLTISFNGNVYNFNSFNDYVKMYGYDNIISGKNGMWEYAIVPTELNAGNYNMSLINGASCNTGEHVSMANSILRGDIRTFMEKKHKMKFTNDNISSQYALFLNCQVVNPTYSDQTKIKLVTSRKNFDGKNGGEQSFTKDTMKQILESGIITNLIELNKLNSNSADAKALRKQDTLNRKKSVKSVEKLLDANAPLRDRNKCSLFLFEGLSAASSFRSVRNPKLHGSYTLRGKVRNVYGLTHSEMAKNAEINDIVLASGLRYDGKTDYDKLRFGKFIISTDADVDGISITAQLVSFFHAMFPEIIERGMLYILKTPLYKLYNSKETIYYYTQEEYDKAPKRGMNTEYYKGLGGLSKDDYDSMVNNPRLVQVIADEDAADSLKLWMQQSKHNKDAPDMRKKRILELGL